MHPSHFFNESSNMVADAIDGEILAANGQLTRLDGGPGIRVVVRSDWDCSRVAIISGGGAGHEPAHVGFVGKGMLTAAVCGDIFASPSTEAVLAAILAVSGPAGALLIVKNYTGDRLNFGLAAERARSRGHQVEMVIVGDDVALPDLPQPRGVAGTLFVHKVAGYVAEGGGDLAAVKKAALSVAKATRSFGMALSACTVPGSPAESRIPAGEAELGLGIHGEPGVERVVMAPAKDLVATVLTRLAPADLPGDVRLAILINNLGGLPPIELAVVTKALLESPLSRQVELVFGPASLMTSLDMKGFSFSILPLDDERRAALRAPVTAKAWPSATEMLPTKSLPMPPDLAAKPSDAVRSPGASEDKRFWIKTALDTLAGLEEQLNALDSKVGDGDTGTTVARAARAVSDDLDAVLFPSWGETLEAVAQRTGRVMGGSSGVLLSILLSAAGTALGQGAKWPAALRAGLDRVSFYGGAAEGDRTMLDALLPAVAALESGAGMEEAARAAQAGADRTATIQKTRSGRSSYLKAEDLLGVKDPGAVAAAALMVGLAHAKP